MPSTAIGRHSVRTARVGRPRLRPTMAGQSLTRRSRLVARRRPRRRPARVRVAGPGASTGSAGAAVCSSRGRGWLGRGCRCGGGRPARLGRSGAGGSAGSAAGDAVRLAAEAPVTVRRRRGPAHRHDVWTFGRDRCADRRATSPARLTPVAAGRLHCLDRRTAPARAGGGGRRCLPGPGRSRRAAERRRRGRLGRRLPGRPGGHGRRRPPGRAAHGIPAALLEAVEDRDAGGDIAGPQRLDEAHRRRPHRPSRAGRGPPPR